jgi:hypothetical protein
MITEDILNRNIKEIKKKYKFILLDILIRIIDIEESELEKEDMIEGLRKLKEEIVDYLED